jgi:hypothetical protein
MGRAGRISGQGGALAACCCRWPACAILNAPAACLCSCCARPCKLLFLLFSSLGPAPLPLHAPFAPPRRRRCPATGVQHAYPTEGAGAVGHLLPGHAGPGFPQQPLRTRTHAAPDRAAHAPDNCRLGGSPCSAPPRRPACKPCWLCQGPSSVQVAAPAVLKTPQCSLAPAQKKPLRAADRTCVPAPSLLHLYDLGCLPLVV